VSLFAVVDLRFNKTGQTQYDKYYMFLEKARLRRPQLQTEKQGELEDGFRRIWTSAQAPHYAPQRI
jgi:hypothetical protein